MIISVQIYHYFRIHSYQRKHLKFPLQKGKIYIRNNHLISDDYSENCNKDDTHNKLNLSCLYYGIYTYVRIFITFKLVKNSVVFRN
jgi:hypothetical protein